MNCHLVSVKVSVECGTGQGVKLNSLALDHAGLECLNTQSVQRWSTVQKYRVALHHVLKDVPNNRFALVDDFLSRLYRLDNAALNELAHDKRLVELGRHVFRKTAFVQL